MGGRWKYLDVALQVGDNLRMWKGCWMGTVLVALSGQIIIIVSASVMGLEGIIQRSEVAATGMNVCGTWDIAKEHFSFIAYSFLANRAVIHDGWFVRGWNGAFILQNCLFACWQAMYCWSMMASAIISSYVTPVYPCTLILYWADRLPCKTGKLKTSYIWSCSALFCMGTLMRSRNHPSAINMCVLKILIEMKGVIRRIGKCIVEGSSDSVCLSILLRSSRGSMLMIIYLW